jgi:pyrroloquinoline quinone biosynthesis protein B
VRGGWRRSAETAIAGAGEKRVRTRTLASLAISGDGERWTLINASPDLRAQIQNNRQLHPRQPD